ncbi:hypothetical protein V5799_012262 [Amblyomma americanum]|uniref:Uncharacterized protein n=1 Tax=Amblyomma americanum TaxID=6943 RepID=A0AAQ4EEJ2_AMBAM
MAVPFTHALFLLQALLRSSASHPFLKNQLNGLSVHQSPDGEGSLICPPWTTANFDRNERDQEVRFNAEFGPCPLPPNEPWTDNPVGYRLQTARNFTQQLGRGTGTDMAVPFTHALFLLQALLRSSASHPFLKNQLNGLSVHRSPDGEGSLICPPWTTANFDRNERDQEVRFNAEFGRCPLPPNEPWTDNPVGYRLQKARNFTQQLGRGTGTDMAVPFTHALFLLQALLRSSASHPFLKNQLNGLSVHRSPDGEGSLICPPWTTANFDRNERDQEVRFNAEFGRCPLPPNEPWTDNPVGYRLQKARNFTQQLGRGTGTDMAVPFTHALFLLQALLRSSASHPFLKNQLNGLSVHRSPDGEGSLICPPWTTANFDRNERDQEVRFNAEFGRCPLPPNEPWTDNPVGYRLQKARNFTQQLGRGTGTDMAVPFTHALFLLQALLRSSASHPFLKNQLNGLSVHQSPDGEASLICPPWTTANFDRNERDQEVRFNAEFGRCPLPPNEPWTDNPVGYRLQKARNFTQQLGRGTGTDMAVPFTHALFLLQALLRSSASHPFLKNQLNGLSVHQSPDGEASLICPPWTTANFDRNERDQEVRFNAEFGRCPLPPNEPWTDNPVGYRLQKARNFTQQLGRGTGTDMAVPFTHALFLLQALLRSSASHPFLKNQLNGLSVHQSPDGEASLICPPWTTANFDRNERDQEVRFNAEFGRCPLPPNEPWTDNPVGYRLQKARNFTQQLGRGTGTDMAVPFTHALFLLQALLRSSASHPFLKNQLNGLSVHQSPDGEASLICPPWTTANFDRNERDQEVRFNAEFGRCPLPPNEPWTDNPVGYRLQKARNFTQQLGRGTGTDMAVPFTHALFLLQALLRSSASHPFLKNQLNGLSVHQSPDGEASLICPPWTTANFDRNERDQEPHGCPPARIPVPARGERLQLPNYSRAAIKRLQDSSSFFARPSGGL